MRNRPILRAPFDEDTIEPLVRRTRAGEPRVWPKLWLAIDPVIEEIAGRFRVTSRLSSSEDERRDVVVSVMERLQANDFERLAPFHEALLRRDGSGRAWLSVVTRHAALNHTRGHAENLGDGEHRWAEMVPLPDDLEELVPAPARTLLAIEAHRIQACAAHQLPRAQFDALRLWLLGYTNDEIAVRLELAGALAAVRLVRAALEALRRRFPSEDGRFDPLLKKTPAKNPEFNAKTRRRKGAKRSIPDLFAPLRPPCAFA